jgi:hypothetical protein
MPAAHQRSAMFPLCQCLTLRLWVRAMEIIDSIEFVLRNVRASVGGTARRSTVSVSDNPSRSEAAAPGWVRSSHRRDRNRRIGWQAGQLAGGIDLHVAPIAHARQQHVRNGQQVITRARLLGSTTSIFETWPVARLSIDPIPPAPKIDTTPVRLFR